MDERLAHGSSALLPKSHIYARVTVNSAVSWKLKTYFPVFKLRTPSFDLLSAL